MAFATTTPSVESDSNTNQRVNTKRTMNLEDLAKVLGVSRSTIYDAARRDALPVPVIKIARRYVISADAVERLLAGNS